MSNSPLVDYTQLSPNNSGKRTHSIDRITPHCVVGQLSVETMGNMFAQPSYKASCNYDIGSDGRVGLVVPEDERSWCSSSSANDQRAVTIECASDKTDPYAINSKVYAKLIELMADVCRRNGKTKVLWFGDKDKTLAYEPKADEMMITVHRWFAAKACPGDYIYNRLGTIAETVTKALSGSPAPAHGMQAKDLNGLSEAEKIAKVAPLYQEVARKTGLLASVGLAQFCLESGYGTTELAQNANNLHGMKSSLSGNTWAGSTWDGKSKYNKKTQEQDKYGNPYYIYADFRKYPCIEDSIADRAAYYLGAMNGSKRRYPGIENLKTAEEQVKAIKAGGYATDVNYVSKLMNIINRFNLTQYDVPVDAPVPAHTPSPAPSNTMYRVQAGAYQKKGNANNRVKKIKSKTGFDSFVEQGSDGIYRVICGSFSVKANAEQRVKDLKAKKVDSFIVEVTG